MTQPLRLDYAVNDAEVIAAFKRQQTEMENERKKRQDLEKQINSNAAAQKSADKAMAESSKEAAAIAAKYRTEEQKTAAEIAKVNKLRDEGALSAEDYAQAITHLTRDLKAEEKAARDAVAAEKTQSAVMKEAAAIVAKFSTEQQKNAAELQRVKSLYDAGALSIEQYEQAVKELSRDLAAEEKAARDAVAAEKAHTAAVRDATQIAEKYATKEERVATELARLNALKVKGVLSSKDYARAVAAENAKLEESTIAVSGASGSFTDNLTAMTAAGIGAVAFVSQLAGKMSELGDEIIDDVEHFDKLSRKLGIQGGLSDVDRKEQSRMVGKVAFDAAVPIDKAFETATQLSSSGFQDPVKGGTLNTALALMQGSNQIDGDAASFIKGGGQFMTAFGMKKDNANLADLGIRMQGLFKSTDVQAADLPEFAKAAPVLSGAGLNLEQSLSTLTALRVTMNAGEAATGARNVVSMLQTSGANNTAKAALADVGLRPEQVDIQGEGLKTALETLKVATAKLGDADRAEVLTRVFGRENVAAASILMESTGKLEKYGAMQREAAATFVKDVNTARTGSYANSVRADVTKEMDSVKHEDFAEKQELARQARINIMERRAKDEYSKGTVAGKFNAAVLSVGNSIENNIVRPVIGENENLGLAHVQEMNRLASMDGQGRSLQYSIPVAEQKAPPVKLPALRPNQFDAATERVPAEQMFGGVESGGFAPASVKGRIRGSGEASRMDREFLPDAQPVVQGQASRSATMPKELANALDRQTAVLERIAGQNAESQRAGIQKQHAGLIAGRSRQTEGGL